MSIYTAKHKQDNKQYNFNYNDYNPYCFIYDMSKWKESKIEKEPNSYIKFMMFSIAQKLERLKNGEILWISGYYDNELKREITKEEFEERFCKGKTFIERFESGEDFYKEYFSLNDDIKNFHFKNLILLNDGSFKFK